MSQPETQVAGGGPSAAGAPPEPAAKRGVPKVSGDRIAQLGPLIALLLACIFFSSSSSISREMRSCARLSWMRRLFSSAAPTWLAMAESSFWSLAVKRPPWRRPIRLITPTVRASPVGGV